MKVGDSTSVNVKKDVRQFLSEHFPTHKFQDEEDIFGLGFVNSLFAMQLVLFIEDAFQITVEDEDLQLDNFRSINALTRLVENKKSIAV